MQFLSRQGGDPPQGNGEVRIIGGDERSLRELLVYYIGAVGMLRHDITIYVGQLPSEGTDIEIPTLPDDLQLVGSVDYVGHSLQRLFYMNQPLQAAVAAFEESFLAQDWQTMPEMAMPAGFQNQKMSMTSFCNPALKLVARLNSGELVDGRSAIRLTLEKSSKPCDPPYMGHHDMFKGMPNLITPPNTVMLPGRNGTSGGGNPGERHLHSQALIVTEMSVADLADSYYPQLQAEGWQQRTADSGTTFAVSTWYKPREEDSPWTGYFSLIANPQQENQYNLWLQIYEQTEE